jgi:hypothetical protein
MPLSIEAVGTASEAKLFSRESSTTLILDCSYLKMASDLSYFMINQNSLTFSSWSDNYLIY